MEIGVPKWESGGLSVGHREHQAPGTSSTWGMMMAACRCSWCTGGNRGQVGSRAALGGSNAALGGRRSAPGGSTASCRCIWARRPSGWCNGRRAPSRGRRSGSRGRRSHWCGRRTHGSTSLWSAGKAVGGKRKTSCLFISSPLNCYILPCGFSVLFWGSSFSSTL